MSCKTASVHFQAVAGIGPGAVRLPANKSLLSAAAFSLVLRTVMNRYFRTMNNEAPKVSGHSPGQTKPRHIFSKTKCTLLLKLLAASCVMGGVGAATPPADPPPTNCGGCSEAIADLRAELARVKAEVQEVRQCSGCVSPSPPPPTPSPPPPTPPPPSPLPPSPSPPPPSPSPPPPEPSSLPPSQTSRCRESRNDSGSFGRPSFQLAAPSAAPGTTAGSDQEAGADTARSSGSARGTRRRLTERSPRGPTGPEPPPVRV